MGISPWHDIPLEAGDGMYNFVREIPNVKGDADVGGAFGDDDPIDVVEIGASSQEMGAIVPVKPLGVLSMIDDGDDIEKYYPGTVSGIREWFRWYKTPNDKPINGFGHGEKALNAAKAVEVIKETNEFYLNLKSGKTDAGKLSLK